MELTCLPDDEDDEDEGEDDRSPPSCSEEPPSPPLSPAQLARSLARRWLVAGSSLAHRSSLARRSSLVASSPLRSATIASLMLWRNDWWLEYFCCIDWWLEFFQVSYTYIPNLPLKFIILLCGRGKKLEC